MGEIPRNAWLNKVSPIYNVGIKYQGPKVYTYIDTYCIQRGKMGNRMPIYKFLLWSAILLCTATVVMACSAAPATVTLQPTPTSTPVASAPDNATTVVSPPDTAVGPVVWVDLTGVPIVGDPSAEVVIGEVVDYQCPACAQFHVVSYPGIASKYVSSGRVRFAYIDLPVVSSHPNALEAAIAAHCANAQGALSAYQDLLFTNQSGLTVENFVMWAGQVEIDETTFLNCYESREHMEQIIRNGELALSLSVRSTPSFLILKNQRLYGIISGALSEADMSQIIETVLTLE